MADISVNRKETVISITIPAQVGVNANRKETYVQLGQPVADVAVQRRSAKRIIIEKDGEKTTAEMAYEMAQRAISMSEQALENSKDSSLKKYTVEQYDELRSTGQLEHKMYCVYDRGRLCYIYIYRTLIAKRADDGQTITSSKFPYILPIIFS